MKFFSRCNRPATIPVSVGSATTPSYEEVVTDGVKSLVQVGETNLYDYVQASKEETLIYNLLDRFTRGDINALLSKKGQFLDVTGLPTTLAEAQQLMINVNNAFNRLSREERAKFGSVDDYIQVIAKSDVAHLKEIFGIGDTTVKDGDVNVAE